MHPTSQASFAPYAVLELVNDVSANSGAVPLTRETPEELLLWLSEAVRDIERTPDPSVKGSFKLAIINHELKMLSTDRGPPSSLSDLLQLLGVPPSVWTIFREVRHLLSSYSYESVGGVPVKQTSTITRNIAYYGSGFAWKHYAEKNATVGILWLNQRETIHGLNPGVGNIVGYLIELNKFRTYPLLPALLFMRILVEPSLHRLSELSNLIWQAQIESGFHSHQSYKVGRKSDTVDFSEMAAFLNGCSLTMIVYEQSFRGLYHVAEEILEQNSIVHNMVPQALETFQNARLYVEDQTIHLKKQVSSLVLDTEMWNRRATTIGNGISNILTQREQRVSTEIAKQSRILAEESKKDSTSMEAIAAVTMCFLPGTFIASFFSMSIFEMDVQNKRLVSHQMWLYWAITIPLTIMTIACWTIWKTMSMRYWQQLRLASDQAQIYSK